MTTTPSADIPGIDLTVRRRMTRPDEFRRVTTTSVRFRITTRR